ncbi:10 kDa chaperonin, mitochondrial [Vitis vinifera]|uniref:10 kDa chaperonin, mitochondrial n=1 Tax=Vitis vinifera TaxID=29760 RepID=A0A438I7Y5_VITVI|nr:10 kDa chaperonin, mitochondrial [Vitis vinifera]
MAKRLIPTLNRILVEKIVPPSKTNAGILLPEKTAQLEVGALNQNSAVLPFAVFGKPRIKILEIIEILAYSILHCVLSCQFPHHVLNSGKVVAVGPGARDRDGKLIPLSVREGDTVLLPEYGGNQVKLGDKECV